VTVFEQANEISEIGAGLTLSPNAVSVIDLFDLRDALEAVADSPGDGQYLHYQTAALLHQVDRSGPYAATGKAGFFQVHRSDMLEVLLRAAEMESNCELKTSHNLVDFDERSEGVTARFDGQPDANVDLLVGCDGLRSVVRDKLVGPDQPRFTGQIAWRCLVDADAAAEYMGAGTSAIFIGPGAFFNRYHVRNSTLVNCVAIAASDAWREEGWTIPSTFEEFRSVYPDWHSDVVDLVRQAPADQFYKWALYDRTPVRKWAGRRVALLGDAAHPMLPFMGMGAAFAMEDAVVLARCLEAEDNVPAALATYQETRRDRCGQAVLDSRTQGEILQKSKPETYGQRVGKAELRAKYFDYEAGSAALAP
jgi:salicylate hydroxylase